MPAVLKSSFSKSGIGTLSLVHPFQATKGGPDPGNVSSALHSRRKGQEMYFNQVEFGQRLQECRKLQKMTQEELAELVGVEKQHISRIERGVAACSIDLLPVLSITLQVSADYLLMGKSIDKELTRTQLLSVISQLTLITQGL